MLKKRRILLVFLFLIVISIVGYVGFRIYWQGQYPYGRTHRCSKCLAMEFFVYAENHDGNYPSSPDHKKLGMSDLIDSDSLELIVGKAGNLAAAEKFYAEHGYITPEHSSWHYVNGLNENDKGMALAWDKISLDHWGRISKYREVIMTYGMTKNIANSEWPAFLKRQKELLAAKKKREAHGSDPQE